MPLWPPCAQPPLGLPPRARNAHTGPIARSMRGAKGNRAKGEFAMSAQTTMTRQQFVAGAALAAGAATLGAQAAFAPRAALADEATADYDWAQVLNVDIASVLPGCTSEPVDVVAEKDCDVLVIGAGVSGSNTAIRAGELGKKVILVEKTGTVGGASNLSSGPIGYNSRMALEAGEQTDTLELLNNWIKDSHYRVDPASIKQLLDKSGEAIDWMTDNGWEFTPWFSASVVKFPDYAIREQLFLDAIERHVVPAGGELMLNTAAKRLVVDADGKVCGAIVVDADGAGVQINAGSVVIATGGYGANLDMVERVFRFRGVLGGLPQNVGEGLEMAWRAGAQKPQNFGGQMLHQTLARANDPLVDLFEPFPAKYPMILCYVAKLMNVSASGTRFRNEESALSAVAAANTSAYQGSFHYVVVSKGIMDILEQQGLAGLGIEKSPGLPPRYKPQFELDTPWEGITEVFDAMVEAGAGFKGDTPAELAEAAGMDVDIFTAQFEAYEGYCAAGVDEQLGKAAANLIGYGEGPYYIIVAEENNLGSWGGLLTNTNYEALGWDRLPVKGLYAVGNEAGSCLFNDTYVGAGIALGNAVTSGYVCGTKLGQK